MNNILKSHIRLWLILGLMAAVLLTLAFQGGDTDPAHCGHCQPPTPTPTDTPTSLPPQACQVAAVEFDKAEYLTGDPIKVTLRVSDSLGAPLIGANVDATVSRQPFTDTLEASAIPPLEDQSGTYDGIYTQTDLPGLYTFKFDVSDFTGPRFLPCSAEATVRVVDDDDNNGVKPCTITLDVQPNPVNLGNTVNLTATVTETQGKDAQGTAIIQPPVGLTQTIALPGDSGLYTGPYTPVLTGTYHITGKAIDLEGGKNFTTCSTVETLTVTDPITPPNGHPTVGFNPPIQIVDLCGRPSSDITSTLQITGVTNLARVDLSITYDRTFIIPAQITPRFGSGSVSQSGNTIRYIGSSNTPVNGTADLLLITWRMQGRDGITPLALTSVLTDTAGMSVLHTAQNGTLEIDITPPCLRCTTNLQGRTDHSGVMVTSATGEQTQSYPNGLFVIASTGDLKLTAPGYLSAQMAASAGLAAEEPDIDACQVNLLAGDLNGDNTVNILDLSRLAGAYQSTDPTADLNASGLVDILDLTLAAGNYQRQGQ